MLHLSVNADADHLLAASHKRDAVLGQIALDQIQVTGGKGNKAAIGIVANKDNGTGQIPLASQCDDLTRVRIQKYAELARENCPDVPERVHPHLWRHTRAMHLYQHGMDLTMISQWLGHKQVETTLIYAYADTEAKRKAIEKAMGTGLAGTESVNYTVSDEDMLRRLYGL